MNPPHEPVGMSSPPPPPSYVLPRLLHPHYLFNLVLLLPVPLLLLLTLPSEAHLSSSAYGWHVRYSIPLAAMPMLVRLRAVGCLETRVTVFFSMMKLYNVGALLCMQQFRAAAFYFLVWTGVSAVYPRPRYQGPSNLRELTREEVDTQILGVPPELPGPSDLAGLSPSALESLVAQIRAETVARKEALKGKRAVILPFWGKERVCWDVEVLLARVSLTHATPDLSFNVVDLSRHPSVASDLELSLEQFGPRSGLPCLIMYAHGKEVIRFPPSDADEDESEKKKRGKWVWSEEAIVDALEKLQRSEGHFAVF